MSDPAGFVSNVEISVWELKPADLTDIFCSWYSQVIEVRVRGGWVGECLGMQPVIDDC